MREPTHRPIQHLRHHQRDHVHSHESSNERPNGSDEGHDVGFPVCPGCSVDEEENDHRSESSCDSTGCFEFVHDEDFVKEGEVDCLKSEKTLGRGRERRKGEEGRKEGRT